MGSLQKPWNKNQMDTNQILTLQALKFKQDLLQGEQDLSTDTPAWMRDVDPGADDTRNICALISVPLFEQINNVCNVLSMSKRRFVELALRDLTEKAVQAVEDVGITSFSSFSSGEVPLDQV